MKTFKQCLFISLFSSFAMLSCTHFLFLVNSLMINDLGSTMHIRNLTLLITISGSLTYLFYLLMERGKEEAI